MIPLPFVIMFWFCCWLVMIPIGIIIGIKLYQNVKQEERKEKGKVLQRIMKTYVVIQCVAWPLILTLMTVVTIVAKTTSLTANNSALETLLRSFISTYRFLYILTLSYVGFNSLIIAICRYTFIVLVQHDDTFTIKRIRKWVLASSLIIPVLLAVLHEATIPMHSRWVDILGQMVTPDNDTAVMIDSPVQSRSIISVHQSPIFNLFDYYVPIPIKSGIGIACNMMKIAIFSNLLEGCIYTHIFIHNRRSENRGVINALLSEEARIKRYRKKTINIQMTCISWSLEFVSGLIGMLQLVTQMKSASIFLPLAVFSTLLNFIIIPTTYLLNTELCKAFIFAQGWWKAFRILVSSNRVAPSQNSQEEQNENLYATPSSKVVTSRNTNGASNKNDNTESNSDPQSDPIPTVSGNIDSNERIGLRILKNNYM